MVSTTADTAESLRSRLYTRTANDPKFWDFSDARGRPGSHGFFQYPAMMVPDLQGSLLDDLLDSDPTCELVYDPFMGSGTVLLESIYRGLSFYGTDINPMAVLLSTVKAHPPARRTAEAAGQTVLNLAASNRSLSLHSFTHRDKWFNPDVALELTRLRSAITALPSRRIRRFMWVCLAETVRLTSNSRLSTFKLHSYAPETLAARTPDVRGTFERVVASNAERADEHRTQRVNRQRVGKSYLLCRDVLEPWTSRKPADVVMTSPPYGDNHTTIPYGQFSYLPLQWIDRDDLPSAGHERFWTSTSAVDTSSMGGRRGTVIDPERRDIARSTPAMAAYFEGIESQPALDAKVTHFVADYTRSLQLVSDRLRPGGFSFWTLGERQVGGQEVPLVAATQQTLESLGHSHVETLTRKLPNNKRMSARNSSGTTMMTETIVIMQKGNHT